LIGLRYLKNDRLKEAEEETKKSLAVYEAAYVREPKQETADQIALSRESLAEIFEAQGHFLKAKETRLLGESDKSMVCASDKVSPRNKILGPSI
jgi:hypothetical protein